MRITAPSAVDAKRKTSVFLRRLSLYLKGAQYHATVAIAYSSTEKILFDVQ